MAMITKGGGKRQTFLVIVLVILAVIVGIYLYSTRKAAPTPVPAEEAVAPEMVAPEAITPEAAIPEVGEARPLEAVRPEALSPERISKILEDLRKLDLVLHGKLPIEVDPAEVGRANPFIPY